MRGGVDFRMTGGNGGIARDHDAHLVAYDFHAERMRRDVEQDEAVHASRKHARLQAGSHGDAFIGVHAVVGRASRKLAHSFLNCGDAA